MNANDTGLGFVHRYVPATAPNRPPLLLLHGTGGNEDDLLPLGEQISPGAALLSPRGKVLENGMPRFFRRLAMGVFDIEDLRRRSAELATFVRRACAHYGMAKPIAVGFSNGANIAAAILLTRPETFAGAILLRPVTPFVPDRMPHLAGLPVLMLSGTDDPIASAETRDRLKEILANGGARVTHELVSAGHNLVPQDVVIMTRWLAAGH